MKPILSVADLHVSFAIRAGKVQAARGVSYDLYPGEVLGIVGESGSGKSVSAMSILRLLASNASTDQGVVLFQDQDLLKISNKEMLKVRGSKISMIFQDPMSSLNPLMTVGDQIAEMIHKHDKSMSKQKIREKVLSLFASVRIPNPDKRYSAYPHEFSGGMRQRVMIAMALSCDPDIIIADEPTTALDVTIQAQILKLMKGLQKERGISILFITHDLGVVAQICTRVVVMYGGMVLEEGLTADLFQKPSHPYTLGLLAAIPDITQEKERPLTPIPGSPPDMLSPPTGCPFYPRCSYARNICMEEMPKRYIVSDTHFSRCWLLAEDAPFQLNPLKEVGETL